MRVDKEMNHRDIETQRHLKIVSFLQKLFYEKKIFSVSSVPLWLYVSLTFILTIAWLSEFAIAKDEVATVVAIRNKAVIERDKKERDAKVKDSILLIDTVSTLEASKAKMLFIDDSVLTLGEKSKVVIKEFVYSKEKGGRSIFNLIDGKMRSIVGKTEFEVHTPTTVAAARGTVILFETGILNGRKFTTIICLEGEVNVRSIDPKIKGILTLKQGMMITAFEGKSLPSPIPAPLAVVERLKEETDTGPHEISIPAPTEMEIGTAVVDTTGGGEGRPEPPPPTPPINQPPVQNTPVDINVIFTTPVNVDVTFP